MPWSAVSPVMLDCNRSILCQKPYHGHRSGCPNFNKKKGCPPNVPLIGETIDLCHEVYAVWNVFPFGEHVQRMKDAHPDWSQRQLACCLYWQGKARKQLRGEVRQFLEIIRKELLSYEGLVWKVCDCPEAQGVNLTATMESIGIKLEWPPKTVAYQIVLAGRVRDKTTHDV